MIKGINGWTFPAVMPIREAAQLAKAAGFAAFEPILGAEDDGAELTPTTDETTCRRIGDEIRSAGLQVASLATALFWRTHYTLSDVAGREAARELTIACLDRAAWLGAQALLVVPGLVRHDANPRQLLCGYSDALARTRDALGVLVHEAERRGVVIAIENVWNSFLLSPVELRDLLDRVNSPWVGAYFDVGNVLKFGVPEDWIDVLGQRITRVHVKDFQVAVGTKQGFVLPGDGDANWPAIMQALRRIGYDGPMVAECKGDLADISARMDRILNDGTL